MHVAPPAGWGAPLNSSCYAAFAPEAVASAQLNGTQPSDAAASAGALYCAYG